MILRCRSRGSATESPTGHLISRRGPRTSLPFSQETGPQVLGSSLPQSVSEKGGSRAGTQGSTGFRWSSIHWQQAKVPTSCSCQGAGSKTGCWGVLSPSCAATSGSAPYLEIQGRESKQREQPDPAVGSVLGSCLQLRAPCRSPPAGCTWWQCPSSTGQMTAGSLETQTRCTWHYAYEDTLPQPQQGGPSPFSRSGYGLGTGYLTPGSCLPPCSAPCAVPHSLPSSRTREGAGWESHLLLKPPALRRDE